MTVKTRIMLTGGKVDIALEKQLERAEIAYWNKLYHAKQPMCAYRQAFGGGLACTLPDLDILGLNRVIGLGLEEPVTEALLDDIIKFYRRRGTRRFFVQLSPAAQKREVHTLLVGKGFRHYNNWAKLAQTLPASVEPVERQPLQVRTINRAEAFAYGDLIVEAFDWPIQLASFFAASVGLPGYRHYLACHEGRPIAAAALHIDDDYASMAIAGTLLAFRRMGAQQTLLHHRLREAHQGGCRYVVSETGENLPEQPNQSYRNLRKAGFQEIYLRKNYLFIC